MGVWDFDLGDSKKSASDAAPDQGNSAALQAGDDAIAASKTSRKRRPGKDAPNSGGTGGTVAQPTPELRAEIARQLEQAYDPKAWASLLALPADAALAITGRKHWEVSKDERETLGACGSVAARYLMVESPRTLALLMISSALFTVYVPRVGKELQFKRLKPAEDKPNAGDIKNG